MKKLFGLLLIIAFFLFLTPSSFQVQGQLTSVKPLFDVLPGVNCGLPDAPNNKCCAYSKVVPYLDPLQGNNNILLKPLKSLSRVLLSVANLVVIKGDSAFRTAFPIPPCVNGAKATHKEANNKDCLCVRENKPSLSSLTSLCNNLERAEQQSCQECVLKGAVWTGIGCVYANLGGFIENNLLGWGIGLAGIIALLCIIYSAFILQTSKGNPEKIKKAQELLTSCVMGLLLIIFSVFILKLIGVDILKIPGFGK